MVETLGFRRGNLPHWLVADHTCLVGGAKVSFRHDVRPHDRDEDHVDGGDKMMKGKGLLCGWGLFVLCMAATVGCTAVRFDTVPQSGFVPVGWDPLACCPRLILQYITPTNDVEDRAAACWAVSETSLTEWEMKASAVLHAGLTERYEHLTNYDAWAEDELVVPILYACRYVARAGNMYQVRRPSSETVADLLIKYKGTNPVACAALSVMAGRLLVCDYAPTQAVHVAGLQSFVVRMHEQVQIALSDDSAKQAMEGFELDLLKCWWGLQKGDRAESVAGIVRLINRNWRDLRDSKQGVLLMVVIADSVEADETLTVYRAWEKGCPRIIVSSSLRSWQSGLLWARDACLSAIMEQERDWYREKVVHACGPTRVD